MPALREAIGDKAFEELEGLIVEKVKTFSVSRDEFREVLSRLDIIEHDISELKEGLRTGLSDLRREMNERFDRVNERFDRLYKEMNERFDGFYKEMNERFDGFYKEINVRFDMVDKRFDGVYELFDKMYERSDRMYWRMASLVKWTVGTLALFGSIISILLAVGQFVK